MTQTIKIKRSTGSSAPATLAQGELAYSKSGNKLYIGDPAAVNTPILINEGQVVGVATSADDVLSIDGSKNIAGVDAGSDQLVFWDDSLSKLAYGPIPVNTDVNVNTSNLLTRLSQLSSPITLGNGTGVPTTTSGNLTVTGNLTVNGTTTTLDTATLQVEDNNIVLNFGAGDTSGTAPGAGITIQDATSDATPVDAVIGWTQGSTTDYFTMSHRLNFSSATEGDRGILFNGTQVLEGDGGYRGPNGTLTKPSIAFGNSTGTGLHFDSTNSLLEFGVAATQVMTMSASTGVNVNGTLGAVDGNFSGAVTATGLVDGFLLRVGGNTVIDNSENLTLDGTGELGGALSINEQSASTAAIVLDSDHTGARRTTENTVIEVNNGTDPSAVLRYNHNLQQWQHGVGAGIKSMGTITGITGGTGLNPDTEDVDGNVTLSVDLSELTNMSADMVGTDQFIVLDAGADRKKTANAISLAIFDNSTTGFTNNVGTITGITGGTGLNPDAEDTAGNVTLSLDLSEFTATSTFVSTDEFVVLDSDAERKIEAGNIAIGVFNTATPSFTGDKLIIDSDHTGAALSSGTAEFEVERGDDPNAFLRYNHATGLWEHGVGSGIKTMGTITGITGGTGIDPDTEDTQGNVTISVDFSELTSTSTLTNTDEFIVNDGSVESRITAGSVNLSVFNNDSNFTSNVGDITGLTVRNNSDQGSADSSIVFGSTGANNSASVSSGSATFRLQVGTIDGGTY